MLRRIFAGFINMTAPIGHENVLGQFSVPGNSQFSLSYALSKAVHFQDKYPTIFSHKMRAIVYILKGR